MTDPDTDAAYAFVETMKSHADGHRGASYPLWHGWALRKAFLAGVAHARCTWPEAACTCPHAVGHDGPPAAGGLEPCPALRDHRATSFLGTMASLQKHHRDLTDGEGKCSVPMWCGGLPAGFCDRPAYGRQTEPGRLRYSGYVPALACTAHGGPAAPP